jgi:hypothetical protein
MSLCAVAQQAGLVVLQLALLARCCWPINKLHVHDDREQVAALLVQQSAGHART